LVEGIVGAAGVIRAKLPAKGAKRTPGTDGIGPGKPTMSLATGCAMSSLSRRQSSNKHLRGGCILRKIIV